MAVRKFKPTTPGQRHKIIGTFEEITASVPEKSLVYGKKSSGGRNNEGKMTMRYIGGGQVRRLSELLISREIRTVFQQWLKQLNTIRIVRLVSLCCFMLMEEKRYIIAPNGLQVGATLMSGETAAPEIGNALPLQNIPVGTVIHNIELRPGQGAALVRSAGNFAQLTSREGKYCVIKLPSGEVRQIT